MPSLEAPDPDRLPPLAELEQVAAVRLFVERARAVAPGFTLTARNAAVVATICQRLDGLPLAVELVAARVALLTPEHLAARLDDALRLLTGGSRTAPTRQQTLRATIDWSSALLTEAARAMLRRLSVFAGDWVLAAAEAVCAGDGIESGDVLDLLAQLVDNSLVLVVESGGDEEGRYRLLETVRQYAWQRLHEAGEATAVQARHARLTARPVEPPAPADDVAGESVGRRQDDRV